MHDRDAVRVDDLAGHRQARAESRQQIPQPRAAPGLMQLTPLAPLADDEVSGQIKFQCSGWGEPVIDEMVDFA
jgi:hypothetical protein